MIRFFLGGLGLIGCFAFIDGAVDWANGVTAPSGGLLATIGFAKSMAGIMLLALCAGFDELIRLLAKIERSTRSDVTAEKPTPRPARIWVGEPPPGG